MQISEQNKQWGGSFFVLSKLISLVLLRLSQLKYSKPNLVC